MTQSDFIFPDMDEIGIDTLDAISFAPRFNKYMYDTIKGFCSGEILEVGSGIGNISSLFIQDGASIHLSDIRDNYVEILKTNFADSARSVSNIDIAHPDFDDLYRDRMESFDSIFALNVVEHIKDDGLAIRNCKKLLKPGGKLVILVPAYMFMYNSFDTALEHYRRYTSKSLRDIMEPELKILHQQYFNVFGMLGWFVSGKILKKKTIPKNQMQLYDRLILVSKTLDKLVLNKIGLSTICIGEK